MKTFTALLCLFSSCALADTQQQTQLLQTVDQFIKQQTSGMVDAVSYKIEPPDSRVKLKPCQKLEAFLPSSSQLIGKTIVGVRCQDQGRAWEILVPVQIKITTNLVTSAKSLNSGQVLSAEDLSSQTMEITRPTGFNNPEQVIGKVMRYNITAGQVIREDMLRLPYSVTQGQTVQIIINGNGFSIRNEGVALNNATVGQNVQIRTNNGKVVSGMVNDKNEVLVKP